MTHLTPTTKVGNIGITFRGRVVRRNPITGALDPVNISTQTTLEFTLKRPDGTSFDKPATLFTDGSDGYFVWTTTATADLDQAGDAVNPWQIEGHVVLAGGDDWTTRIGKFLVEGNL
jgi:hypothetical protein